MNEEKWGDIVELIEQKFGIIDRTKEEMPIGDDFNEDKAREKIDSIIFDGPLGRMKVQNIIRPVVLDKKAHYTKTIGQGAQIEIDYSDNETTSKIKAFKWDDIGSDWVEIEAGKLDF